MSASQILLYGDEALRKPTSAIEEIDGSVRGLSDHMIDVMAAEKGLGVAANQVGFHVSMFVYLDDNEMPRTVINPEIQESSGTWRFKEGCLSLPGIIFDIARPKLVTLTGIDLDGNDIIIGADTLTAWIFQHEIDHLKGKLIIDKVTRQQRREAERMIAKVRRNRA